MDEAAIEGIGGLADPLRAKLYRLAAATPEGLGRDAAAAAAGVSRAVAAYHLDKLAQVGLLEADYRRPEGRGGPGAGRPAKLYRRAAGELRVSVPPRDYELAAMLFAEAFDRAGGAPDRAALLEVAEAFGARLALELQEGEGVERLLRLLEQRGYEPVRDEAGVLRLRNCPFHRLAERHTELVCGMNLSLLRGALAASGGLPLQARLDPRPGFCCVAFDDLQTA